MCLSLFPTSEHNMSPWLDTSEQSLSSSQIHTLMMISMSKRHFSKEYRYMQVLTNHVTNNLLAPYNVLALI